MPGIDPFDEESDDQIVQKRHLKKKKRGKSDSAGEKMPATKKRKKQSTAVEENEPTMEEKEQMLQEGIEEARMQFENDRDELLASLPSSYSEKFKEIGFAKWAGSVIPVLVLSPYDVPPGKVRNDWMKGYENVSCGYWSFPSLANRKALTHPSRFNYPFVSLNTLVSARNRTASRICPTLYIGTDVRMISPTATPSSTKRMLRFGMQL